MAPAAVKFDPSNVFCIPNISMTVAIKASISIQAPVKGYGIAG